MKNKVRELNVKLGQLMVKGDLKKKKGSQEVLAILAVAVVTVALVMVYKKGASGLITDLTGAVGENIRKLFTGM